MKTILSLCVLLICSGMSALDIAGWKNIRFTSDGAAANVHLRAELMSDYRTSARALFNPGSGVKEYEFSLFDAAAGTYQAVLPASVKSGYVGLRAKARNGKNHTVPVFYTGTALPGSAQLTKVSADPKKDVKTDHYDLVADYMAHSDARIYTAIQNRGGGFPTSLSLGTVYPSYMAVIANPADDPKDPDVVVWALVYIKVSVAGLSPGLFRIQHEKLTRIGNIQHRIDKAGNLLVMSCSKADLVNDPAFAKWYNKASPVFGFKSIINRTAIIPFGTTVQDESPGSDIYPVKLYVEPALKASSQ